MQTENETREMRKFFFPLQSITIEAVSLEDAEKKLHERLASKDKED